MLGRLAAYVRDKRIPLELCPSSNVQTGAAPSIAEHPIGLLRDLRFRVTVNTDNRLMSGTSMSREMALLVEAFGYGWAELQWFTINAMKSAFIPFDERLAIINEVIKPAYADVAAVTGCRTGRPGQAGRPRLLWSAVVGPTSGPRAGTGRSAPARPLVQLSATDCVIRHLALPRTRHGGRRPVGTTSSRCDRHRPTLPQPPETRAVGLAHLRYRSMGRGADTDSAGGQRFPEPGLPTVEATWTGQLTTLGYAGRAMCCQTSVAFRRAPGW